MNANRADERPSWRILIALGLLAGLFVYAQFSAVLPAWADGPADLVRIPLSQEGDLYRVLALDLDVLALVPGRDGAYLVARLPARDRAALENAPLTVELLESAETTLVDTPYYLAESLPLRAESAALPLRVLYDDGRHALVRLDADATPETGALANSRLLPVGPDPIVLSTTLSGDIPDQAPHDPLVAAILTQVTTNDLHGAIGSLSGEWPVIVGSEPYTLTTRHSESGEPLTKATQYVYEYVAARGWQASYHDYVALGRNLRNVIGQKNGAIHPERIVMLTAHLDSRERSYPHDPAPGADDNASGCAALMVAADLLDEIELADTVRLVFFTGEEQGLYGSQAYAGDVAAAGEHVVGVINLDMIAWDGAYGPDFDIHTHLAGVENDSDALGRLMAASCTTYGLDLAPQVVENGVTASDHAPFWNHGYAAILSIEDYMNPSEGYSEPRDFNPYYHTVNDLLTYCDTAYAREMTRAALATLLHVARPVRQITGEVTDATSGVAVRARVTAQDEGTTYNGWTDPTGTYTLTVPSGVYVVSSAATAYHASPVAQAEAVAGTSLTVNLEPVPCSTAMALAKGWNLTALPRVPQELATSEVLEPLGEAILAAYQYDGADGLWRDYFPQAPDYASNLAEIDPADGLWLKMNGDTSASIEGAPLGARQIALVPGWNLVPYPGARARTTAQAMASIEGQYETVYAQATPGERDAWLWHGMGEAGHATLTTMQPGESYWIKATTTCTWTAP